MLGATVSYTQDVTDESYSGLIRTPDSGSSPEEMGQDLTGYGFVVNEGQVLDQNRQQNPSVRYLHPDTRFNVALKRNGYSYDLFSDETPPDPAARSTQPTNHRDEMPATRILHVQRVDVVFEGTNAVDTWTTSAMAEDHMNVINEHGSFELLHHYGEVTQHDLYPGVDIRYTAGADRFKQDLIAASPEALGQVRFRLEGATASADGNTLRIRTSRHTFVEEIPLSYIVHADGSRDPLAVTYVQNTDGTFGFRNTTAIPEWNEGDRVVVDPTPNRLQGSYFSGTNGTTTFYAVLGGTYMAGTTTSTAGLATAGAHDISYAGGNDAVLVKMTTCTRAWATYYGGSGLEQATSLAWPTGDNANLLIAGYTGSGAGVFGFPGTVAQPNYGGGTYDGFVAKFLTSTGQRTWGTYCGGTGADLIQDVTSDQNGNVFVVGNTSSSNMASAGAYDVSLGGGDDAFWRSYPGTASSVLYSTYYGGAGSEVGYGIELTGKEVYICGMTTSTTNIATAGTHQTSFQGVIDAFLARFTAGFLTWGTYYGGAQDDIANGIALIGCGYPTIVGSTSSNTLIAFGASPYQAAYGGVSDGFIAKFNPANGTNLFGTYYGGTDGDMCHAIVASGSDLVYVAGHTSSTDAMASAGSWQPFNGGMLDGWCARFSIIGSRIWGTYYGGTSSDDVWALSTGPSTGNVTIVGGTLSPNAIASVGCYDVTLGAGVEGFYATFDGPGPTACSLPGMVQQTDPETAVGGLETRIYPMPFADAFTIHTVLDADADAFFRLVDLTGRTVLEQRLGRLSKGANSTKVQCPHLADGMYTWMLQVGDALRTGSVVRSGNH